MFLGGISVIILFLLASYLSNKYEQNIKLFVTNDGPLGMIGYVFITIVAVVIAPISTLPLIPLAGILWGWIITALLSIIGWVIGSQVAFLLARKYGKPLIKKLVSLEKLEKIEKSLPERNIFWVVVLLRMTVPVDVLSYALGLFSNMTTTSYFFATLLGVAPFAFIFSYTGTLSLGTQIITLIEFTFIISLIYIVRNKNVTLDK